MACATLKRSLDWESINQRPSKRRRCQPFGAVAAAHHHQAAAAGCSRVLNEPTPSVFADTTGAHNITPEIMAQNIRDEIHRLHRSKQLHFSSAAVAAAAAATAAAASSTSSSSAARSAAQSTSFAASAAHYRQRSASNNAGNCGDRMQDSDNSGSEMMMGSESPPRRSEAERTPSRRYHQQQMQHHLQLQQQTNADKELFSFKQVQLICERMMKEREDYLREQYDSVLTTKLAEQYDAFVKFTYDQIQRRYEAAPSYLS